MVVLDGPEHVLPVLLVGELELANLHLRRDVVDAPHVFAQHLDLKRSR